MRRFLGVLVAVLLAVALQSTVLAAPDAAAGEDCQNFYNELMAQADKDYQACVSAVSMFGSTVACYAEWMADAAVATNAYYLCQVYNIG